MSTVGTARFGTEWLGLRERADAAARAPGLLQPLRAYLAAHPSPGALLIRDLGSGTGSMPRWLAGRLPGPQHWVLHDQDPDLLAHARSIVSASAADGTPVTVTTQPGDLTALSAAELAGTGLVTASALLDLLTASEVAALAQACVQVGAPALFTLSVVGQVELTPADPLDPVLTAAFNAHQRREAAGRRLLGPDAATVTAAAFTDRGATVHSQPSPWRLGPAATALIDEWLTGWVAAAVEHRPELGRDSTAYLSRRRSQLADGELRVVVGHRDLLALPPASGGSR